MLMSLLQEATRYGIHFSITGEIRHFFCNSGQDVKYRMPQVLVYQAFLLRIV